MANVITILLILSAGPLTWWMATLWERHRDAKRDAWQATLAALSSGDGIDVTWDETRLTLTGSVSGRPVEYGFVVLMWVEGSAVYETRASLRAAIQAFELDASPPGLLTEIFGRGALTLETGDSAFDRAFVVQRPRVIASQTADERAKTLLDPETRAWLLTLEPARLHVSKDGLLFEKKGRLDDERAIRSILRGLSRMADRLSERHGYRG